MQTRDIVICRCEDITVGDILDAIDIGLTSLNEIKHHLRAGMGPCQGRTCGRLISQIITQQTGKKASDIEQMTQRPPLKTVPMKILAGGADEE
ncbi:(2Fe-2S)-binding protein [candidate division KSB1 bacterium]|nr:(2Fe-2S)-binding protein [candidate division KSB1 bacterium]